ncbi:hypothetical protein B0A48_10382 [Cryoendolithus antarcticus]|uniref:UDP-glucose 6-dehydrogenase n=1 Tax=Cryoendolithus antarcticus TaxID=1507870 RepID=A0A1V8SX34_9PEZI|nr:hypothetical protein B0A48_10382 [Cryoendolithus antarcticus]
MDRTPSLTGSEDCTDSSSNCSVPDTPANWSPNVVGEHYSIPMDEIALQPVMRADLPLGGAREGRISHRRVRRQIRNVCCIGAGYVGGPTAAMIALHNPHIRVTVVDRDEKRIRAWNSRHLPIHEPGLSDVVRAARDGLRPGVDGTGHFDASIEETTTRAPNLFFSTACAETIAEADVVMISVNTPTKRQGQGAGRATDMTAFEGATRDVATHSRRGCIIVEKSTVPCKTGQLIKNITQQHRPELDFPILSNPEFLSEGTAIKDLMRPDRVIIGCESTPSGIAAAEALADLYASWVPQERIVTNNIWSAELCKLTANAMLAQRISSINSISAICERTGADVGEIAKSIGLDRRIGPQFLKAGLGFGGSCFRKDIASLTYLAESLGLPEVAAYWEQVLTMNNYQRDRFALNVIAKLNNSLRGKKITILGYAFKKDTGDARESPALDVIRMLLEEGPKSIAIFDPLCSEADIRYELSALPAADAQDVVKVCADPYEACEDSSAVLVLTDWDMFKMQPRSAPVKAQPVDSPVIASFSPSTPADLLHLPQRSKEKPPTIVKDTVAVGTLPEEIIARLQPQADCETGCEECSLVRKSTSSKQRQEAIDWSRVATLVRQPKMLFDGRNVLDAAGMDALGFRLETLGRASTV